MVGKLKNILLYSLVAVELSASSVSLRDTVENTINTNNDILAEHYNKKASRTNIDEQRRDYYPTLDFEYFYEDSHTYRDKDDTGKEDAGKDGWNSKLKFDYVLYDGGLTPNEVEEFRFRYNNIKYTSNDKVESLIFETVENYIKMVEYQEMMALDKNKILVHDKYLKIARSFKDSGGKEVEYYQVKSKVNAVLDNYMEQEYNQQKVFSTHKRLTGDDIDATNSICRPIIDESILPKNVAEAIEIALRKNNQIRAQREYIKEQTARARVEEAKFRPTLNFQVQGEWDNDLALPENGQQDIYRVRLETKWNLYNGGKDNVSHQREKIKILKQRKILDAIKEDVIDSIKGSYNSYYKLKVRIKNMKDFVNNNQIIVNFYLKQFENKSRTFVDVLNAEAELFRTKILLIETEMKLYVEYYTILKSLNILSDTVLEQENQICKKYVYVVPKRYLAQTEDEKRKETEDLGGELGLE